MTNKHVLVFCFVTCIGFWKVPYRKQRKYRSRGYQEQILDRELRDMFMLLKHNIFTPGPGQRTTFSFILFFRFIFFFICFLFYISFLSLQQGFSSIDLVIDCDHLGLYNFYPFYILKLGTNFSQLSFNQVERDLGS